jgi:hypothetical protein
MGYNETPTKEQIVKKITEKITEARRTARINKKMKTIRKAQAILDNHYATTAW